MAWDSPSNFALPTCLPCGVTPGLECRSKETTANALDECDPSSPSAATWEGVISDDLGHVGTLSITATPSGGGYGTTDYTLSISFVQSGGGDMGTITDVGVVYGGVGKHDGDTVGAAWCGGFGAQPQDAVGVIGNTTYLLGNIDSVTTDTAGDAGGWIEQAASDLGEAGFTTPYDDPSNCDTGYFHYEGDGAWGMRYFQNDFTFPSLTVDDWYCLTIVYEVRAYGDSDWDSASEVTVYAGFQATATTDGPGWMGLPYSELAWEIEWRMKEYTVVNTGESEDCGGGPPPP